MFACKSVIRYVAVVGASFLLMVPVCRAGDAPQPRPSVSTGAPAMAAPAQARPNAKAVLSGNADAFADFHKALLIRLKAASIEQGGVGCTGCEKVENDLQTQKPIRIYVFSASPDMLAKMSGAWGDVKTKNVSLTFGDYMSPDPDCGPPKPQPCVPNFFCGDKGFCSATFPACRACGT